MPSNTNSAWFKQLNMIYFALLAGQFLVFLIAIGFRYMHIFNTISGLEEIFMYIVPAVSAITIYYSFAIYRRRLQDIAAKMGVRQKLDEYRGLAILRYALLEGGTLFATISYMITGLPVAAVCAAAGLAVFIFVRPDKDKIIADLQLSTAEAEQLEDVDLPVMDQ